MLSNSQTIRDRLCRGELLVSDGAVGTELLKLGITKEEILLQNCVAPHVVRQVHESYLKSGVDLITANTFGMREIPNWYCAVAEGLRLAADCAEKTPRPVGVLFSLVAAYVPLEMGFIEHLLKEEGCTVAILLLETCTDLGQAVRAVEALRAVWRGLLAVTCHINSRGQMLDGTTLQEMAQQLTIAGADILGANCGDSPADFIEITKHLRYSTDAWLLIQPGQGKPSNDELSPGQFASLAHELYKHGANIVGGCCGIGPEHIASLFSTR